jgi:Zn-finger nucleic acid-binding protein
VESRRFFQCRHCGTYHFPETVEYDGTRVVGHSADGPKCPVCATGMSHALLDDDHRIDFCGRCRGVLLPRATFAHVTNKRRAWAISPPAEPVPVGTAESYIASSRAPDAPAPSKRTRPMDRATSSSTAARAAI